MIFGIIAFTIYVAVLVLLYIIRNRYIYKQYMICMDAIYEYTMTLEPIYAVYYYGKDMLVDYNSAMYVRIGKDLHGLFLLEEDYNDIKPYILKRLEKKEKL